MFAFPPLTLSTRRPAALPLRNRGAALRRVLPLGRIESGHPTPNGASPQPDEAVLAAVDRWRPLSTGWGKVPGRTSCIPVEMQWGLSPPPDDGAARREPS